MVIAGALVEEEPPRKLLPVELCRSRTLTVSRYRDVTQPWAGSRRGVLAQARDRSWQQQFPASSQQHAVKILA